MNVNLIENKFNKYLDVAQYFMTQTVLKGVINK